MAGADDAPGSEADELETSSQHAEREAVHQEVVQHAKRFVADVVRAAALVSGKTAAPGAQEATGPARYSVRSSLSRNAHQAGLARKSLAEDEDVRNSVMDPELQAQELAEKRSREKVKLYVTLVKGGRLGEVTLQLGNSVRDVGQCLMRLAALPIIPQLFFEGRRLQLGNASEPSESLMDSGIPSEQASITAELCTAIVTASKDCTAKVWNAHTGVCELSLEGHSSTVYNASFSPTCRAVVTASEDRTARIWRAEDGRCMRTLQGHRDAVYSASYSPDGKWVVTASEDGTGKIWIVKTGDCKCTLRGHSGSVLWATYAPDGKHVTTTSRDGTLRIWNAKTGVCDRTLSGQEPVYLVSFTSDGTIFVTQNSGDCTARICNLATGECERELRGHRDLVLSASFAPALRGEMG
mmetsp:Transcript_103552/g.302210  ORF Transcript_103552/g.302210 Transcript_103552/m.302210 type:complete len:410 (-) Transcript_103552:125-1354(-)